MYFFSYTWTVGTTTLVTRAKINGFSFKDDNIGLSLYGQRTVKKPRGLNSFVVNTFLEKAIRAVCLAQVVGQGTIYVPADRTNRVFWLTPTYSITWNRGAQAPTQLETFALG